MEETLTYIQNCINIYFPFLKEQGFLILTEEKNYFICPQYYSNNGKVELAWQYQGFARLLHLSVDKYNFRLLEPKNKILIALETGNDYLFDILYHNINKTRREKRIKEKIVTEQKLKHIEKEWLIEMGQVLQRHLTIFNGDLSIFEKNIKRNKVGEEVFTATFYRVDEDDVFVDFTHFDKEFTCWKQIENYMLENPTLRNSQILDSHWRKCRTL